MRLPTETVVALAPFVPGQDLLRMHVVTTIPGRWLPAMLRTGATTIAPFVCFRAGTFDPTTPRGLALIAHEAHHLTQVREMGWLGFYARYFVGQFRCGFNHAKHPLEMPAIDLQRFVAARLREDGPPVRGSDSV